MKYYVVSDVHGFYTELKNALDENGFFNDSEPHKLILCGDMMDRGDEAVEMQNFMLEQHHKGDLIFIRGNHEDLILDLVDRFDSYKDSIYRGNCHHVSNGTVSTLLQLANCSLRGLYLNIPKLKSSPFIKELIPSSLDYFETEHYVFVHGWIPCNKNNLPAWYGKSRNYEFNEDWRSGDWNIARWTNGIDMAMKYNITVPNKTIVCGHWHCSYGNFMYGNAENEVSDFKPFKSDGILAIDACTALSGKVNCVVLYDSGII